MGDSRVIHAGSGEQRRSGASGAGRVGGVVTEPCPSQTRAYAIDALGTRIALDYKYPRHLVPADGLLFADKLDQFVAKRDEPMLSMFTPDELNAELRRAGFTEIDHVSPEMQAQRYLEGRGDMTAPAPNFALALFAAWTDRMRQQRRRQAAGSRRQWRPIPSPPVPARRIAMTPAGASSPPSAPARAWSAIRPTHTPPVDPATRSNPVPRRFLFQGDVLDRFTR